MSTCINGLSLDGYDINNDRKFERRGLEIEKNLVKRVRVPTLALVFIQENAGREECHAR